MSVLEAAKRLLHELDEYEISLFHKEGMPSYVTEAKEALEAEIKKQSSGSDSIGSKNEARAAPRGLQRVVSHEVGG
jgi:hypothetical protein